MAAGRVIIGRLGEDRVRHMATATVSFMLLDSLLKGRPRATG
jgi:hypothetical protein